MKVICRHGHFAFYPDDKKELLRFRSLFKILLVAEDDFYTFEGLAGLPRWSQALVPYGTISAITTYEGRYPYEVMRENGFVYSLPLGILVPYVTIAEMIKLPQSSDYIVSPKPLIQPGSITQTGKIILGYQGQLDLDFQKLYIYSQETLL